MQTNELTREGARVLVGMQRLPLLRAVLPRLSGDGATPDLRDGRPELSRESLPRLRRMPVCVPVRAAARVRDQRAANVRAVARAVVRAVCVAGGARRGVSPPRRDDGVAARGHDDRAVARGDVCAQRLGAKRARRRRRFLRRRAARRHGRSVRRRRVVRVAGTRDRRGALHARAEVHAHVGNAARIGRRTPRRADVEPLARRRQRLRHGARGAHAVAAPAASRDVLRLRTLLRIDLRRDAVSLGRRAGAVCLHEPSRAARQRRRRRPGDRHCGIARCSGAAATQRYRTQPTAISIIRSSSCCCSRP